MPHYYDAAPAGEERHDQATLHIDGRDFSFVTSSECSRAIGSILERSSSWKPS